MNKPMKTITLSFIFALMAITVAAPLSAQTEGTLTIYNKNCKTLKGLKKVRRVTVHVYDLLGLKKCTNKKVTVGIGQSKTITLQETRKSGKTCVYTAEAMGTYGSRFNIAGDQDSRVTCRRSNVCICDKPD